MVDRKNVVFYYSIVFTKNNDMNLLTNPALVTSYKYIRDKSSLLYVLFEHFNISTSMKEKKIDGEDVE